MATPRFNALRDRIRTWSNRDVEALPDVVIENTMMWAADKAYRTLRVPPLEATITYTGDQIRSTDEGDNRGFGRNYSRITVPGDLIEFIHIRQVQQNQNSTGAARFGRVYNEKADIRTFLDAFAEVYNDFAIWARQGNEIFLFPQLDPAAIIEMYYYRRLPALNARYEVTLTNYNLGLLETAGGVVLPAPSPAATNITDIPTGAVGQEVPNWLRDENERIIIFGALSESFAYLQENEEAQKYMAMFQREIQELNHEDQMRTASGGNVQINFNGRGLI